MNMAVDPAGMQQNLNVAFNRLTEELATDGTVVNANARIWHDRLRSAVIAVVCLEGHGFRCVDEATVSLEYPMKEDWK